jgi:glycosyltransferase involved in cell wall biosynthesis
MRIVMVTDDARIDRRILAESESLARYGHEVIIVAGWENGLRHHSWHGPVKIERFSHDHPVPVAEDYGFPAGNPFLIAPPSPLHRLQGLGMAQIFRTRRFMGLMIRKSRALVVVTTAIRRSFRRLWNRALAGWRELRRLWSKAFAGPREPSPDSGDRPSPVERKLAAHLRYLDPDVIHAHDLPQLRVGVEAKRALGIPLIYDAHELYPEINTLTPRDKAVFRAREHRLLPECDQVITVNPLIAAEMARRYGMTAPLVIQNAVSVPNGFDAAARHDRFREEFRIGNTDIVLLYQGWLAMHRGLPALVRAMPLVPDNVHLVFLGYGALQDLHALAHQLGLRRRVHLKDAVSQDDLLYWTASADIGLIPYPADLDLNTRLCSPNKLYEFIEAGLPILGNEELPFVRHVIASNDFGRVAVLRTPEDFARAITAMANEGRAGLDRFKQNILRRKSEFAWEVEEKKLLQAYEVALRRPARVSRGLRFREVAVAGRS